jgi:hypothetical protein
MRKKIVDRTVILDNGDTNYVCTVEEKEGGYFVLKDQHTGAERAAFGDDVVAQIISGTAPNLQLI